MVSRFEEMPGGNLTWLSALNWKDLESVATDAVEAQGGAINVSGHYSCPDSLASRAVFKDQEMWLCDLAQTTGVPHSTLRLALNENRLKGRKEGGRWRSSVAAVEEAVAAGRMRIRD